MVSGSCCICSHLMGFSNMHVFLSYACKGQFMCSQGFPACACLKHVLNLTSAHLLCPLWIHQTAAIFLASQHLPRWDTVWDVLLGPNWIHRNRTLLRHPLFYRVCSKIRCLVQEAEPVELQTLVPHQNHTHPRWEMNSSWTMGLRFFFELYFGLFFLSFFIRCTWVTR